MDTGRVLAEFPIPEADRAAVVSAMIDRLIHHSEILSLKGDSYRLRGKDLDTRIGAKPAQIG